MSSLRTEIEQGLKPNIIVEFDENTTYLIYAHRGDMSKCAVVRYLVDEWQVDENTKVKRTTKQAPHGAFNFVTDLTDMNSLFALNYELISI